MKISNKWYTIMAVLLMPLMMSFSYPKCFIYGYNGSKVIATVANAGIHEVAHTSFEKSSSGNWTFNGNGIVDGSASKYSLTGEKAYNLSVGSITKSFSTVPGKKMVVSYWSKSGAQQVNGAAPAFAGRVVNIDGNTWTYFEHLLVNPTAITVSGTAIIDELRLYPEKATMETYTYKLMTGMTTKCDVNNLVVYYEYDLFKRISVLRNHNYQVLKKFCYGNAGQQEDCTGTYFFNVEKSAVFTRNDCTTGYQSSQVNYTVAPGTYLSSVSQQEADQIAQAELDAKGQVYANFNGICQFVYKSIDYSGNYYSELCAPNLPQPINISVPAGMFTSVISQQDANNKAFQYAQGYANTNGSCTSGVEVSYINNSGDPWPIMVKLTYLLTSEQFFFDIYETAGVLGNLPIGPYNVEITMSTFGLINVGCNNLANGPNGLLFGVLLEPGCNTIEFFPY